ncbi:MAG: DUF1385 domain-containing protein [Chloroflexi bacterium]|nr:DUF1385 domain-containing protein [Chloroflexota bacterium]
MKKQIFYGGQAVIEGVMMRGQNNYSIAVRQANKNIVTTIKPISSTYNGRLRTMPLLRGILVLIESLILGIKALYYSADVFIGEEDVKINEKTGSAVIWFAMILGLVIGIGLFIAVPWIITTFILNRYISTTYIIDIADGVIRLVIVLLYMWGIGFIPSIRRVFSYHGAEHKTINAYEAGAALEADEVAKYSTAHARCGTAFLLNVLIISMVVFILIGLTGDYPQYIRLLSRLLLLPVIAAIAYEIIKFEGKYYKNKFMHILLLPGLALQKLTTRQPDKEQIEVGITALKAVIAADEKLPVVNIQQPTEAAANSPQ